jgi:primary-amine oxidase
MKLERSFIENEDQGKINWDANAASTYAVVNKDTPNQFGEYPGYKIYPSTNAAIHSTVENDSMFLNCVNWATHPLYVLKRKDSEPASAWQACERNKKNPMIDFNDFFDGESLDQEDLTLYFNLGMHHVPDTYDLPDTVFSGAASGITIRPVNYLPTDASRASRNQVKIQNGKANYNGASLPAGSFDLDSTNPHLGN